MKKKNYFLNFLVIILITIFFSTEIRAQYDLYTLDVKTGITKRVTTIANTGEWNASWSNNGKKIAHDVAGINVQAIYVTDVETGISTPLAGAENGNDAAWSPDGGKIAFDAWEDYYNGWWTQNIYTVPASGGTKTLLRFNAHHASWNPKENKIAFDDNNYPQHIGTKDINTGYETF